MVFEEAVAYCESLDMKIILPQDDGETKDLVKLEYGQFWIAITDSASEGNWTNIYTGEKPQFYTKWMSGAGSDGDHAIFSTVFDGFWIDVPSGSKFNTLCVKGIREL